MTGAAPSRKDILHRRLDAFVKGSAFSVLCFVVWGAMAARRSQEFLKNPSALEALWLCYNATIAILFLVRTRPQAVSLDPVHWLVALVTSFSGLLFESRSAGLPGGATLSDALLLTGLAGSFCTALALRRNYDFLPALRGVTTGWPYSYVRHPMYAFSILIRAGYMARHASLYNALVLLIVALLYDRRAKYEEGFMLLDARYREYRTRVRWKFVPGLY